MTVLATDTIAYVFRFTDIAQAQSDSVVGPIMAPGGIGQELLVYANVIANSVTPESGFWLLLLFAGGVQAPLFSHPNLKLCFDMTQINTGSAVLSANVSTAHICMVIDNYFSFIQNGVS